MSSPRKLPLAPSRLAQAIAITSVSLYSAQSVAIGASSCASTINSAVPACFLDTPGASTSIGSSGSVNVGTSNDTIGIYVTGAASATEITNAGTIDGAESGIWYENANDAELNNLAGATISAEHDIWSVGVRVNMDETYTNPTIDNAGLISANTVVDSDIFGLAVGVGDMDFTDVNTTYTIPFLEGPHSGMNLNGDGSITNQNTGVIEASVSFTYAGFAGVRGISAGFMGGESSITNHGDISASMKNAVSLISEPPVYWFGGTIDSPSELFYYQFFFRPQNNAGIYASALSGYASILNTGTISATATDIPLAAFGLGPKFGANMAGISSFAMVDGTSIENQGHIDVLVEMGDDVDGGEGIANADGIFIKYMDEGASILNSAGVISSMVDMSDADLTLGVATGIRVQLMGGELGEDPDYYDGHAEIRNQATIEVESILGGEGFAGAKGIDAFVIGGESRIVNEGDIHAVASFVGDVDQTGYHFVQAVGMQAGYMEGDAWFRNSGQITVQAEGGELSWATGMRVGGNIYDFGIPSYGVIGGEMLDNTAVHNAEDGVVDVYAQATRGEAIALGINVKYMADDSSLTNAGTVSAHAQATTGSAAAIGMDIKYVGPNASVTNEGTVSALAEVDGSEGEALAAGVWIDEFDSYSPFLNDQTGVIHAHASNHAGTGFGSAVGLYVDDIIDGAELTNLGSIRATSMGDNIDTFAVRINENDNYTTGYFTNLGNLEGNVWLGDPLTGNDVDIHMYHGDDGHWYLPSDASGDNAAWISGDFDQAADAIIEMGVMGNDDNYAQVRVQESADFSAMNGGVVPFEVRVADRDDLFTLSVGDELDDVFVADAYDSASRPAEGIQLNDNSLLFDFTTGGYDGSNDVDLQVTYNSALGIVGGDDAYSGLAGWLDNIFIDPETISEDLNKILLGFAGAGNAAGLHDLLTQFSQNLANEGVNLAGLTADAVSHIILDRFDSGLSAGDQLDTGVWVKPFYVHADQDEGDNNALGYEAEASGIALGIDHLFADCWRIGLGLSYANVQSEVDHIDSSLESDAWQASIYAHRGLGENAYLQLLGAYGYSDNDSQRVMSNGYETREANAEFDTNFYRLEGQLGYVLALSDCLNLLPELDLAYTYVDQDGFTEKEAGDWGQEVDSMDEDVMTAGLNLGADYTTSLGESEVRLSAYVGAAYDVIEGDAETSAVFLGGGPAFITEGVERDRFAVRGGVGARMFVSEPVDLSLNFDFEGRDDYFAQGVSLNVRYSF
jgi:hypothetical protein